MNPALPRRWQIAIWSAAAFSFLCKLLLALNTFGTNDVYAWERFAHWSGLFGSRLYAIDPAFNHPPSMIHALALLSWLAKSTGVFFPFWLRLPAILADLGSLWVLLRIFEARLGEQLIRWGLLLFALSPALILVSGFHGNTDSIVMFFLLLAVWRGERDAQSGAAFGAAMCVKILPVIVLPVLFFARREWRRRAVFLASGAVLIVIAWSPYLFRNPADIYRQVVHYSSIYGHWGLTWLTAWHMPFFRDSWHEAFQRWGAYGSLTIITASAWAVNRKPDRPPVYTQIGAALFFFLAAANGFGVQYLAWLVPWTVGLDLIAAAFFACAGGAFLLAVYNFWAGGFPWYLADSNYVGDFVPHLDYLLTLCWISVIVLACAVWRRRPVMPSRGAMLISTALAIPLIAWPLWNQVIRTDRRTYPAAEDRAALSAVRAREYAMLSEVWYGMGRYTEAVDAARAGVALNPAVPEPWTRIALGCIALGRRDEALNAATTAVRLAPEDETANAALAELQGRRY
ncbi:MAG TPA: glycosyltransferase 87 family protein [Bryobacteraceae bacterium]|nr:glycosyltransferase 87 family protein [Bryobacteraceae bacterium]